jgi:PAS domain S-box-containing protein
MHPAKSPMNEQLLDIACLMSNSLAIQTILTSLGVLCVGTFALIRERGTKISLAFSLVTLTMGVWLFCFSWMYSAPNERIAMWWAKSAYIGVGFIPAAVYHYGRLLRGDTKFSKGTAVVIVLGALFVIAIIKTDMLFGSLYHYQWGYYPKYGIGSLPFLLYFFGVMFYAVRHASIEYRRATKGSTRKTRTKAVLFSFVIGYLASFDYLAAWGIPVYPFGYIPILIFIGLSGYAIMRYRLLNITPAAAAHQIIETMHDALIVLDMDGIIRVVNKAACRLFGYQAQDLVGSRLASSLVHSLAIVEVIESSIRGATMQNYEAAYQTPAGTTGTLSLTTSILQDKDSESLGIVCVMRDITEHKRADEDLRQSLSLQQATLESTADGILVVSSNGRLVSFNTRFAEMWRLPQDILAFGNDRQTLAFVLDQLKDPGAFLDKVQQLYDHPEMESFDMLQFKDGRVFERYSKSQRISNEPVGRVWSFRDVTERRQAEELLQRSALRLRRAEEVANFGNWEIHLDSKIVLGSDGAQKIYGLEGNEWPLSYIQSFPLPEYRTLLDEALTDLIGHCKPYNVEFKVRRPADGRIIDIQSLAEYDPENRIVFGVIQDITERTRSAEALRKSEEKYRTLFEESKDVIFVSTPDGRYLDMNPAGLELFGYSSKNELFGLDIRRDVYVNPDDRKKFQQILEKKGFMKDYEIEMKRKDGKKLTFMSAATAVKDDVGQVIEYRGSMRDITEHKRLEQQLLQAQKMEAVGQLAGGVAHDFNNILSAIIGYGYLLKEKMNSDDPLRADVEQILESADRAAEVTRNLLAFSRKQIMNVRPVNVKEIIMKTEKLLSRLIGEDIEINTVLSGMDIICMADSGQIQQVLLNLATNARDAMPQGGQLTISTEITQLDDTFMRPYGYGKAGEYALITVSDNGIGMTQEEMEKIFEPFFTTKETGKGTGLGLAMAYGIIKQHDGYIVVQSKLGEGTTFKIYLPTVKLKEEVLVDDAAESFQSMGTETILVAEDDEVLRRLSEIVLTQSGYKVISASDGVEAISKFIDNKESIQLVILDMVMPKKSGKEVYDAIREIRSDIKVLFSSGYTADRLDQALVQAENINVISKPVAPRNLLRRVREILDNVKDSGKS